MAHREGVPRTSLQIAIFWVSACSVVRRAFLEPSRSTSCKSGLPPPLPASVGEARQGGKWPSCPSGRLGKSGQTPRLERGLPTRRRMLSGGPKCLIVRGSPGRGLQIAIFWVSAVSVVRRAFLEPSRSISCKSGLPPALPASVGEARQPGKWPSCPSGRLGKSGPGPPSGKGPPHASSNAVGWPKMPHREGVPRTRPPNPDFLGFCGLCGAEGISRA